MEVGIREAELRLGGPLGILLRGNDVGGEAGTSVRGVAEERRLWTQKTEAMVLPNSTRIRAGYGYIFRSWRKQKPAYPLPVDSHSERYLNALAASIVFKFKFCVWSRV